MKQKGFTLIELLVVISIIGLLASVVLVSLSSSRMKARDARRKADLKQISTALALYYDTNGNYPIVGRWATSESSSYDVGASKWGSLQSLLSTYIAKLPNDPLGTGDTGPWYGGIYHYAYGSDTGAIYDLVAQLENTNDPDRCDIRRWPYYHGEGAIVPGTPWCNNFSGQIFSDH